MKTIHKKITTIIERLNRLKALAHHLDKYESYVSSTDVKDMAERNLQVAIECCLDVGKIIISQRGLAEPKDNKGIFSVLAGAGLISKEVFNFMAPMAGTRNILVHGYDKIEDSLIYGVLKNHLNDFDKFLKEIKVNCLGDETVDKPD